MKDIYVVWNLGFKWAQRAKDSLDWNWKKDNIEPADTGKKAERKRCRKIQFQFQIPFQLSFYLPF